MADNLTEADLRENIAEIIKNGDLATLTSKKIRKILEKKYDLDLLHRKKQIDDIVMQLVDEQSDDSDDNASAGSPNKNDSGEKSPEEVSDISVNNKEKKKAKAESDSDAEEELQSESESESDDDPPKPKKRSSMKRPARSERSKPAKKPKAEKGEGGAKKKTGFSKPMLLSPELADLMGETHMARSEVVKKMWQIIRERDLLDPTNKRFTICDEQLEKIIGKKRFLTFAMMKYLKRHVKDPAIM